MEGGVLELATGLTIATRQKNDPEAAGRRRVRLVRARGGTDMTERSWDTDEQPQIFGRVAIG